MRKHIVAAFGAAALAISLGMMMVEPASALGGCGFNGHRNAYGLCAAGGQNQNWCRRHKGQHARYVGGGIFRC
jgi:hypothetical protein